MLQRRIFAALLVLAVATVPLAGQDKEKPKDAAKPADKEKAKDPKPADKEAKPADKGKDAEKAPVANKVALNWKLEKGKTFYQKVTTKTEQSMKILSNEPKQTQTQTFYFSWTPEKQDGDNWIIK